jgi:hypothetical protein
MKEKIQALSLAKECYSMKLALLTNATAVDDAIRFVSQKCKENLKSSSGNNTEGIKILLIMESSFYQLIYEENP